MPILFALICLCALPAFADPLSISVHAEAAILMNAETGAILYQKNAHKLMYPASVTKVATALVALKHKKNELNTSVLIPKDAVVSTTAEAKKRSNYTLPSYWLEPDSTHMGLRAGEEISLLDLLYGLMLVSANDAANAISIHVGGTVPNFMLNVNAYLKEIGCRNTQFTNPHGMFDPKHQTTAYDLAVMTREALKDPTFCKIVATVQHPRPKTAKQPEGSILSQSNKLLRNGKNYYPKAIGVKTGYLSISGHTYVSAAKQEGRTLIAVLLKTKERSDMFADAIKLFDTAFKQPQVERVLLAAGTQKFSMNLEGASRPIAVKLEESLKLAYYPAEEPKMKCLVYWEDLKLPIAQNQRIGEVRVTNAEGLLLASAPLLSLDFVKGSWTYTLSSFFGNLWTFHPALTITLLLALLGALVLYFRSR